MIFTAASTKIDGLFFLLNTLRPCYLCKDEKIKGHFTYLKFRLIII